MYYNKPIYFKIDGNFGVRLAQHDVAKEMMSPRTKSSTVLQLNMGEGKSSVIVPLIAASLADTKQLVRIIVLKPLWRDMFHLLVRRLSGLLNRRIYYLPVGRHVEIDEPMGQKLKNLYAECMREGGILLAQPEHILSFKLMCTDWLMRDKSKVCRNLQAIQEWLTQHSRDILDESDEILSVQYQLVYSVGAPQPLEGHPDRWTTTQQLLHALALRISQLEHDEPGAFGYQCIGHGRFPTIRIMPHCSNATEDRLLRVVACDVLDGRVPNLRCVNLSASVREKTLQFLTCKDFPYPEYKLLKRAFNEGMWRGLLLVRGLLASGILIFALKSKIHRVDYGLDLSRSQLAVPFCAKVILSPIPKYFAAKTPCT